MSEDNKPKMCAVAASTENVKKILSKISVDDLQKAFRPLGLGLTLNDKLDGPFISFYNVKNDEVAVYTPTEFVENVKADLWGLQREYRIMVAEYKKKHPELQKPKKEVPKQKTAEERREERKNRKHRGI